MDGRCKEDGAARAQTSHQAGSLGSGRAVQDIPGSSADGSETGEVKKGQGSQIRQRWSRGKEEGRTGGSGGGDVDDMQREEERRRRDEAEESAGATVEGRGKVKSERGARIGRAVGWQAGWAFGRRAVGGCPISARLEPFLFLPRCTARCAALLLRCVLLCCSASCSAVLAAVEPVTRDMPVQISLRCDVVGLRASSGLCWARNGMAMKQDDHNVCIFHQLWLYRRCWATATLRLLRCDACHHLTVAAAVRCVW